MARLRKNRWTLVALVVLVAVSVWWSFRWDWQHVQDSNPTKVTDVARGDHGEFLGADVTLLGLKVLAGDSPEGRAYGVAEGTDVVIADLRIDPRPAKKPDDFDSCDVVLHAPSPDGEREWGTEVSNPTTYPGTTEGAVSCNLVGDAPYVLRNYFVVPGGGADVDPYVQITVLAELPRALHLH